MGRKKPEFIPRKSNASLIGIMVKAGLTVVIGLGLLGLLVYLSNRAGQTIATHPRFETPVTTIVVDPPMGLDRDTFITEVRAVGNLPEKLSAVANDTSQVIAQAFAKHPWVENVVHVQIADDHTIKVELKYRVPVLAIPTTGDPPYRMVDKTGFVLPPVKLPDGITLYKTDAPRVQPQAGKPIGDEAVKRASELVEIYKARLPRVIERIPDGWRIVTASGQKLIVSW